jgi:hypothetical protein
MIVGRLWPVTSGGGNVVGHAAPVRLTQAEVRPAVWAPAQSHGCEATSATCPGSTPISAAAHR